MEFSIFSNTENGLARVVLTDPASRTQVIILPEYGAMLHAFIVQTKNGMHNIIDSYKDAEEIKKELCISYKSSKLSPFACRIPEGKYRYDGHEFELENKFMDGTAIHGLLYNKVFKKADIFYDEHRASASFKYNYKAEDNGYPFNYSCEVRYTLLPKITLQVQTTIINLDDLAIPVMDGWHPYFTLGGRVNDWLLYFGSDTMVEFDEKLVPTGRLLPYHEFNTARPVADTMLDNCFLLNGNEGYAACTLRNDNAGLQLNLFPDASYPYLQIYTPGHRKSIALENLSAAPNAFNNNMGLLMLQPRYIHTFTVHYQVDCK
ncbi:MAG: aldose 1-epimerase [Chitinophagaceae bacterium]